VENCKGTISTNFLRQWGNECRSSRKTRIKGGEDSREASYQKTWLSQFSLEGVLGVLEEGDVEVLEVSVEKGKRGF